MVPIWGNGHFVVAKRSLVHHCIRSGVGDHGGQREQVASSGFHLHLMALKVVSHLISLPFNEPALTMSSLSFSSTGAFLIPYFLALLTCGVPLFLLEVSVGQYLGVGGMSVVGQLCPIFKGVGYAALMMVFLENVYYIIIVAWTLFYIVKSIFSIGGDELPWISCEKGCKKDELYSFENTSTTQLSCSGNLE